MAVYPMFTLLLWAVSVWLQGMLPVVAIWAVRIVFFGAYLGLIYWLEIRGKRNMKEPAVVG
jgi:hypothetical protein